MKNSVNDVNPAHFLSLLAFLETEASLLVSPITHVTETGRMCETFKSSAEKRKNVFQIFADALRSNYAVKKLYSMFNGASKMKRQFSGSVIWRRESWSRVYVGCNSQVQNCHGGSNGKEVKALDL